MTVTVQAEFRLFGTLKREGEWYIAHCPPLDITTQGRTEEEAKKNLIEASELFVVSSMHLRKPGRFSSISGWRRFPSVSRWITIFPSPTRLSSTAPFSIWRC